MIKLSDASLYFQSSLGSVKVSIYGCPVAGEEECSVVTSLETALQFRNSTAGFFAIQIQTDSDVYVINDIFANYRVYYSIDDNYITDKIISSSKRSINNRELQYFAKKGYTTAFGTIYKDILKLPPLGYLKVSKNSIKLEYSFLDFKSNLKVRNYEAAIRDRVCYTISKIDAKEKIFLFLSGGIDSIYLAELLLAYKYNFTAVFIRYDISDQDNAHDLEKTTQYCRRRGIKLEIINYGLGDDVVKYESIVRRAQPMDHSFYSFYKASDILREKYGPVTIINGQSSDSIFCWGISGENTSSRLQRFLFSDLFLKFNKLVKRQIKWLYSNLYRYRYGLNKRYVIPTDEEAFNCALNMPVGYVPLIDQSTFLISYLEKCLQQQWVDDPKIRFIHAKLNYLQGSSNQMPIGSARYGGHNLVLPFLDPALVVLIYSHQNTFKRIFKPRYELKYYLDDAILKDIKNAVRPNIKNEVDNLLLLHRKNWFLNNC